MIRNLMYELNILRSTHFPTIKTIGVGNLTVGGTGKTPMIQYLIELLQDEKQLATLSRGYKRQSKGFVLCKEESEVQNIGDEPMQIFRRYPKITVAVGEKRVDAIKSLLEYKNDTEVVLLDDVYQHRALKTDFLMLLTDYSHRFYKDYVMPYGLLRETRYSAKRADIVVVTKCNSDISESKMRKIESKIRMYAKDNTPVFFTYIHYGAPIPVYFLKKETTMCTNVLLFSGIANPQPFIGHIAQKYNLHTVIKYKDHHNYSTDDLDHIIEKFVEMPFDDKCIVTTEKDMVKLHKLEIFEKFKNYPVLFVPMEMRFIKDEDYFISLLKQSLK